MDQAQQLRNIIKQQNMQRHLARVITVTSGKGGVGKSNVSVNLALQLARKGKRVIILDADFGLANVEIMLGIRPKYNLADVMFRGRDIKEIISTGPENIGIISGGSGIKELANIGSDQMQLLVNVMYELDAIADFIIIDTGAGISSNVMEMILSSTEVILVATPEPTSITDAYALLKTLRRHPDYKTDSLKIHVVGNRTQNNNEGRELFEKLSSVVKKFLDMDMEYLGAIPFDNFLQKAVMRQQPVSVAFPNAPSAKALFHMAEVIEKGQKVEEIKRSNGISSLFSRMFHNYGR